MMMLGLKLWIVHAACYNHALKQSKFFEKYFCTLLQQYAFSVKLSVLTCTVYFQLFLYTLGKEVSTWFCVIFYYYAEAANSGVHGFQS